MHNVIYCRMSATKYIYNTDALLVKDAISFYLLGAFMTDGCISHNANNKSFHSTISSIDKDWLENIRDILCPISPVKWTRDAYRLYVGNNEISQWFIKHGCVPNKTLLATMPTIPDKYLPDFIRGCMDGDGSMCWSYNKAHGKNKIYITKCGSFHLTSSAPNFIFGLHNLLKKKKFKHSLSKRTNKNSKINGRIIVPQNSHYCISAGGMSAFNFIKWVYYTNHPISMSRKNIIAQELINYYQTKSSIFRGGKKYFTKLTEENVIEIKQLLKQKVAATTIAKQFGVSQSNILAIKHGEIWKHIK